MKILAHVLRWINVEYDEQEPAWPVNDKILLVFSPPLTLVAFLLFAPSAPPFTPLFVVLIGSVIAGTDAAILVSIVWWSVYSCYVWFRGRSEPAT